MKPDQDYILYLLQNDNKKGLKLLFDNYFRSLCLDAVKIVGELVIAEDMVQEVFVRFWEQNIYKQIKSNLPAYLYTSVRRQCYGYLQKSGKLRMEHNPDLQKFSIIDNSVLPDNDELIERIFNAIEELPPKTKKAFKAVFVDQMKYKDAADKLGVSVNTIKTLLSKATQKLRKTFANEPFLILLLIFFEKS